MAFEFFTEMPFLLGLLGAILGIAFWAGGIVLAHYIYEHYQHD